MRKIINDLASQITKAILPITYEHKNFADIVDAMCVVMAKTITSTPHKGTEMQLVDAIHQVISEAVSEMVALNKESETPIEAGILEFSKFAKSDDDE